MRLELKEGEVKQKRSTIAELMDKHMEGFVGLIGEGINVENILKDIETKVSTM